MTVQCGFLFLVFSFSFVHSRTLEDSQRLYDHFFNSSKYKDVRPILNQSAPVQVNISQTLTSVENFDVSHGKIGVTGYVLITWKDEIMQWDPASYGNVGFTHLSRGAYWRPGIVVEGLVEDNQYFHMEENAHGFIQYNGQVMLFINGNLKTRCVMDISLFPFDSHVCTFVFYAYKYTLEELVLVSQSECVDKFNFVENAEWEIIENGTKIVKIYDIINVTRFGTRLVIKRRSMFIILHQFLPSFLLVSLNLFTSLVPLNSGERLAYSVTIFLAFVFLMNTVIESIPVNSLSVSLYSVCFVIINVTNSLTVIVSVVLVRMISVDSSKVNVPRILKWLVLWKRKRKSTNRISDDTHGDMTQHCDKKQTTPTSPCNTQDEEKASCTGEITSKVDTEEKTKRRVSWSEVANVLDELYFLFLLIAIVLLAVALATVFVD